MKKIPVLFLLLTATPLMTLVVVQYFLCTRYTFDPPAPFEGPRLHNPYAGIDAGKWVKSNFHAHARAWNGITNGHGSAEDVHNAYRQLGYGIHCVSNYHHIDPARCENDTYLPAYEHGYNVSKTHQLVLGGENVTWADYLLPQTIHNKQEILKKLNHPDAVIILNHPRIRNGYTFRDLARLTGYECMEVLNPAGTSFDEWDAALSAGKKVFITGNDDTHNVISGERVGEMCTFVNLEKTEGRLVPDALRSGKSYGVIIGDTQHPEAIPFLTSLEVSGDTLRLQMSEPAEKIVLTGQQGKLLAMNSGSRSLQYRLKKTDHYARAAIRYANGTEIFLNPVFFVPEGGYQAAASYVDTTGTTLSRLGGTGLFVLWALLVWQVSGGRRGRRRQLRKRQLSLS